MLAGVVEEASRGFSFCEVDLRVSLKRLLSSFASASEGNMLVYAHGQTSSALYALERLGYITLNNMERGESCWYSVCLTDEGKTLVEYYNQRFYD